MGELKDYHERFVSGPEPERGFNFRLAALSRKLSGLGTEHRRGQTTTESMAYIGVCVSRVSPLIIH